MAKGSVATLAGKATFLVALAFLLGFLAAKAGAAIPVDSIPQGARTGPGVCPGEFRVRPYNQLPTASTITVSVMPLETMTLRFQHYVAGAWSANTDVVYTERGARVDYTPVGLPAASRIRWRVFCQVGGGAFHYLDEGASHTLGRGVNDIWSFGLTSDMHLPDVFLTTGTSDVHPAPGQALARIGGCRSGNDASDIPERHKQIGTPGYWYLREGQSQLLLRNLDYTVDMGDTWNLHTANGPGRDSTLADGDTSPTEIHPCTYLRENGNIINLTEKSCDNQVETMGDNSCEVRAEIGQRMMQPVMKWLPMFIAWGNHESFDGFIHSSSPCGSHNFLHSDIAGGAYAYNAIRRFIESPQARFPVALGDCAPEANCDQEGIYYTWSNGSVQHVVIDSFRYPINRTKGNPNQPGEIDEDADVDDDGAPDGLPDLWYASLGAVHEQWLENKIAAASSKFFLIHSHRIIGGESIPNANESVEAGRSCFLYGRGSLGTVRKGGILGRPDGKWDLDADGTENYMRVIENACRANPTPSCHYIHGHDHFFYAGGQKACEGTVETPSCTAGAPLPFWLTGIGQMDQPDFIDGPTWVRNPFTTAIYNVLGPIGCQSDSVGSTNEAYDDWGGHRGNLDPGAYRQWAKDVGCVPTMGDDIDRVGTKGSVMPGVGVAVVRGQQRIEYDWIGTDIEDKESALRPSVYHFEQYPR